LDRPGARPALPASPTRRSSDLAAPEPRRVRRARVRAALEVDPRGNRPDPGEVRLAPRRHRVRPPGRRLDEVVRLAGPAGDGRLGDRKSTRLNSSHVKISYAVFC